MSKIGGQNRDKQRTHKVFLYSKIVLGTKDKNPLIFIKYSILTKVVWSIFYYAYKPVENNKI